ncbi:hypothetical protein RCL1_003195 [Eukaryota sp. TZLM3-RCL]
MLSNSLLRVLLASYSQDRYQDRDSLFDSTFTPIHIARYIHRASLVSYNFRKSVLGVIAEAFSHNLVSISPTDLYVFILIFRLLQKHEVITNISLELVDASSFPIEYSDDLATDLNNIFQDFPNITIRSLKCLESLPDISKSNLEFYSKLRHLSICYHISFEQFSDFCDCFPANCLESLDVSLDDEEGAFLEFSMNWPSLTNLIMTVYSGTVAFSSCNMPPNLETFDLSYCGFQGYFVFENFLQLPNLVNFQLYSEGFPSDLPFHDNILCNLQHISVAFSGIDNLFSLSHSFASLASLEIKSSGIQVLNLCSFLKLTHLAVMCCSQVETIDFNNLKLLKVVSIRSCSALVNLINFSSTMLSSISINGLKRELIHQLPLHLPSLSFLSVVHSFSHDQCHGSSLCCVLPHLQAVSDLHLHDMSLSTVVPSATSFLIKTIFLTAGIERFDCIHLFPNLVSLKLHGCSSLKSIRISESHALRNLSLTHFSSKFRNFSFLEYLVNLRSLTLNCETNPSLAHVSVPVHLHYVSLINSGCVRSIIPLTKLPSLYIVQLDSDVLIPMFKATSSEFSDSLWIRSSVWLKL